MSDEEKPGEQLTHGLEGLHQRIAELQALEAEFMRTQETLKVSEVRYRRLFETAQDGILLLEADTGSITDVNPFLMDMLGYTFQDLVGKRLWEIGLFDDIAESKAAFASLQSSGYIRYEDLPLRTREGERREVEFVSNVYRINGEKVIQCNIRDITDRKRVEKERERLIGELQQALAEIKTLRGIVPICASCKKIRDDEGYWQQVEVYVRDHTEAEFSHGICPECARTLYPECYKDSLV